METEFRAWMVEDQEQPAVWRTVNVSDLPQADVWVRIAYSSLNYKDALALTGKGKVIRQFPMIPGIDLAGEVIKSDVEQYAEGDRVLVTGYGIGETHWGGLSEIASLRTEWLVPVPKPLSLPDAMRIGTAGFTAMLCVMALEEHGITPERGEVIVTGAGGGVGGIAVTLLSKLGYNVAAVSRRPELDDYLRSLGASQVLRPDALGDPRKPLQAERWAGVVDTVGGELLALLLSQTKYEGCAAICGLAGSAALPTTVLPFILRGVRLIGIDSVRCDAGRRGEAWSRLAELMKPDRLNAMTRTIALDEALAYGEKLLQGEIRGRLIVDTRIRE
ncbi:oxidoreductase [Paenibacillus filicis]|uniref:Oxidoreductase n=1 Tax=Paenibacillus gyeongsangnamensis TaxID=3388067 RepID=A0ABT4Q5Z2_9BACL|nr:MDR family oxidoreductase [Paenibacillus filicis]MCZ8512282.1 oxidoreductase [Paenibacillus filicis]